MTALVGSVDEAYTGLRLEGVAAPEERVDIFNNNWFLQITKLMRAGNSLSIEIRKGYRLRKIILEPVYSLQLLAAEHITGELVKDEEGILEKLNAGLSAPLLRY